MRKTLLLTARERQTGAAADLTLSEAATAASRSGRVRRAVDAMHVSSSLSDVASSEGALLRGVCGAAASALALLPPAGVGLRSRQSYAMHKSVHVT